jgi:hypothetical protein
MMPRKIYKPEEIIAKLRQVEILTSQRKSAVDAIRGLEELAGALEVPADRNRRPGGGRKALTATNPGLLKDLLTLVSPSERGDPMSPLRWTCKGLRRLAAELRAMGHQISHTVVGELLKSQKFSLQANSKTRDGESHPYRDAQFGYINTRVSRAWPRSSR